MELARNSRGNVPGCSRSWSVYWRWVLLLAALPADALQANVASSAWSHTSFEPGCRQLVSLDGRVAIFAAEQLVAEHALRPAAHGWVTVPDHHAALWADSLAVEQRPLAIYEEAAPWN